MKKGQKLKRYGNIYATPVRKGKRRKAVLSVLCVAVLVLAGWLIYPPVRDFLLGEEEAPGESVSRPAEETVDPSSEASNPAQEQTPPAVTEHEEKPSVRDSVSGVYLPAAVASSSDSLSAQLKNAAAGEINTILVEAKDANGIIHFDTENEIAVSAKAVADDAFSAEETANAIHNANMLAAARIYVFRDPVASRSVKSMAVTYGNSETRWLDNSADLGGKSWLNPCSPKAQEYIISLAVELTNAGFDEIVLESVQFPSGVSLDKAGYGLSGSFSRRGILQDFINEITSAVESAGGKVIVSIPADSIETAGAARNITKANTSIYGGSPELIAPKNGVLVFSADSSVDEAANVAKMNAPETKWIFCLPNTAPDGTAVSVDDTVQSLLNEEGYIIYNPQGTYIFN